MTVEVMATRGGQTLRVKNLNRLPAGTLNPPGQLVTTIAELRVILGADSERLVEDRCTRLTAEGNLSCTAAASESVHHAVYLTANWCASADAFLRGCN